MIVNQTVAINIKVRKRHGFFFLSTVGLCSVWRRPIEENNQWVETACKNTYGGEYEQGIKKNVQQEMVEERLFLYCQWKGKNNIFKLEWIVI